jgi:hypothetical protein
MRNRSTLQYLSTYLKKVELKNPKFNIQDSSITITNNLFNEKIISDIIFLFLILVFINQNITNEYGIVGIILFTILLIIFLWSDYSTINNITIDLTSENIQICPRNILANLFQKKIAIDINAIEKFFVKADGFGKGMSRYKLKLITKKGKSHNLIDFNQKDIAENIRDILEKLL